MSGSLPDPRSPLKRSWCGSICDHFATHLSTNNLAILTAKERWTYQEVELASRHLAEFLAIQRRMGSGVVAVYANRSPALVVSLLGIIRAGFAFTIIDPRHPHSRTRQCLELFRPVGLLNLTAAGCVPEPIVAALDPKGTAFVRDAPTVKSELLSPWPVQACPALPTPVDLGPDSALYVAFTSGTTGTPKAIVGSHGPVAHFFEWQQRTFNLTARDRVSVLSGLAHDPLLRDVLMPLWVGATVCIPSDDCFEVPHKLYDWMRDYHISVTHLTPGMGHLLLARSSRILRKPLLDLRYAFVGGETLRPKLVKDLKEAAPQVTIINCYGTTETPQVAACEVLDLQQSEPPEARRSPDSAVPIGRGIDEFQLLVLDEMLRLCEPWEVGELYVRTPHLAKEVRTADATAQSALVQNPYGSVPHDYMYRTGDYGYYLPGGSVIYQGRRDRQVKIRGFRIELSEIDNLLMEEADVSQHYVDVQGNEEQEKRLVVYVVWRAGSRDRGGELRERLAAHLPYYMVPEQIVTVQRMPLTPNGKVDQAKLRSISSNQAAGIVTQVAEPLGEMEKTLLRILRKTLYAKDINLDTDIVAAGLNSLQAIEISCAVEDALGCQLSIADIANGRNVRVLAERLAILGAKQGEDLESERRAESRSKSKQLALVAGALTAPGHIWPRSVTSCMAPPAQRGKLGPKLIPEHERLLVGIKNRFLQLLARVAPDVWRVRLHRLRGVHIGESVSIGYDSILETSYPWLICIGSHVNLGIRVTVIAHFRGMAQVAKGTFTVEIRDDAFVGPGVIILPNVTVGEGAVVAAGSVVNDSVPAYTLVQGNPAKPKAKCGVALSKKTTYEEFIRNLRPVNADQAFEGTPSGDRRYSASL